METLIIIFLEFFKTGLFAIGGGLATLPFLYDMTARYTWFNEAMLANMIAVSESTPGPIGINMATYAGYQGAGILGGILATVGLVMPSVIIIIFVARILDQFKTSPLVQRIFLILRPAVTGLIAVAGFEVFKLALLNVEGVEQTKHLLNLVNVKACVVFGLLYYGFIRFKKHPIVYIVLGGIFGVVLGL